MKYLDVTHIAVHVPDLREAERYYCELFDLKVAWRDSEGAASLFADWDEIERAGARRVVIALWCDAFRLTLAQLPIDGRPRPPQTLDHVGLQVSQEHLRLLKERTTSRGLAITAERPGVFLTFVDDHAIEWELDTRDFRDPVAIGREVEARQAAARQTAGP